MRFLLVLFAVVFMADIALAQSVPLDPIFVPPHWIQDVLLLVKSLPVVGPYVVEALKWVGVVTVILTSLTGAILASLKALQGALKLAKLDDLAAKLAAFEQSKFIFWLKYFSSFNAPVVQK